ncbi:hypothetical protein [Cupriavidus sp. BIS7]|uniref:hypothetical protein n=1 Tax=Cupriavidus sp. BIS7 TaxID=1217718 RepID=UPI000379E30C|nr:hypothetical protein [Cupriavidus sp. BIS7]
MLRNLPPNPSDEALEAAYAAGLLRKEELQHGAYYGGRCRNASIARWHAGAQRFVHWRTKFGERYLEKIRHPADEPEFDAFLVLKVVENPGGDTIPDDLFEAAAVSGLGR